MEKHYNSLNDFLKSKYGGKVYKLAFDGGFTCPNRDGTLGTGGCIFCSGRGSGDFSVNALQDTDAAINEAVRVVEGKGKCVGYIAYFQNYTCTYASAEYLRQLYTRFINDNRILALSIGTRPDCLGDDVMAVLKEMNRIKPVWVELGLQTIHPETAEYIRRGYPLSVYDEAMAKLKTAGIYTVVHMIIGLPHETERMICQTAEYIGRSRADGIKLQLLHVLSGTDLADDYKAGLFRTLTQNEYIQVLEKCIQHLPPDMTIHRLTGDGAKKELIAPLWSGNKKAVLNAINAAFDRDGIRQGELFYAGG